jgi:hypothetical protein
VDRKSGGKMVEMSGSSPKMYGMNCSVNFKSYSQKTPLFSGFARKIEIYSEVYRLGIINLTTTQNPKS